MPDNFTTTVNSVLKVGALEEQFAVTGASPVVEQFSRCSKRRWFLARCWTPYPPAATSAASGLW